MREITDHIVTGDTAPQLKIEAMNAFGHDSGESNYRISGYKIEGKDAYVTIMFQNGPIKDHGVNGVTLEALFAIEIDRLRNFQKGPFACSDNAIALANAESALRQLQFRTIGRIRRGVEGTNAR